MQGDLPILPDNRTGLRKFADWCYSFPNFPSRFDIKNRMEELLAKEEKEKINEGKLYRKL